MMVMLDMASSKYYIIYILSLARAHNTHTHTLVYISTDLTEFEATYRSLYLIFLLRIHMSTGLFVYPF